MKIFRVRYDEIKIIEIEIIRKTEHSIWLLDSRGKERREAMSTYYYNNFETFEQAKQYIIEREKKKLIMAEQALIKAKKSLDDALLL